MKRTLSRTLVMLLLLSLGGTFPAVSEQERVTITWFQSLDSKAAASMQSMEESPTWQWIEERLNVNIEWQQPSSSQLSEQFNLMIASRKLPDIIYYNWTNVPGGPAQLISNGLILDLTELIPSMAPNYNAFLSDPENAEIVKQISLNDGTVYMFAKVFPDARAMSYSGFMIRQDWLDNLGLERPTTIDEWEAVLTAFRDGDSNGNGIADEIPFLSDGIGGIRHLAPAWKVRSGLYPSAETGKITFGALEPGYKEFLMKMAQWYQMGLIDPEFAATDPTTLQNKMTQNLGGVFYGAISGGMGRILNLMRDVQPEYNLTGVRQPMSDDGVAYTDNDPLVRKFVGQGAAVSANTEHLEEVMALLDFCYSEEGNVLLNWGIQGESYEIDADGNKYFTEWVTENPDGLSMDQAVIHYAFPASDAPVVNDYDARKQVNYALPQQAEANQIWSECDCSLLLPVLLPTVEDSTRLAELLSEINTYVDEMETKFVMGRIQFDEYDSYIETLYSIGVAEAIEIQQRTYDNYLLR